METPQDVHFLELRALFAQLWADRWRIALMSAALGAAGLLFSLSATPIYTATALVAPAESIADELPSGLGGLGGLSALASFRLGSSNEKVELAKEVLRSRAFLETFLGKDPERLAQLLAVEAWDEERGVLQFNPSLYDPAAQRWLRDPERFPSVTPLVQEAHPRYLSRLDLADDRGSGFFEISFDHESPTVAQAWVGALIREVNDVLREEEVAQAERSVAYLDEQIRATSVESVRQNLFELMQSQIEKKMLAQTSPEYILRVVDPAYEPLKESNLSTTLIVFLSLVLGTMLGVALSILRRALA